MGDETERELLLQSMAVVQVVDKKIPFQLTKPFQQLTKEPHHYQIRRNHEKREWKCSRD
jgi:hypothetical protein